MSSEGTKSQLCLNATNIHIKHTHTHITFRMLRRRHQKECLFTRWNQPLCDVTKDVLTSRSKVWAPLSQQISFLLVFDAILHTGPINRELFFVSVLVCVCFSWSIWKGAPPPLSWHPEESANKESPSSSSSSTDGTLKKNKTAAAIICRGQAAQTI